MHSSDLCLAMINADSQEEVIGLLKETGYWDNPAAWRFYGDRESNYNTIGNQMSIPEAALVEKLINSVDARLINECLVKGIDPEGQETPKSIRNAVAMFFENGSISGTEGLISEWPDSMRTEVARGITLAATGAKPDAGFPSFTISDCGEGQTPTNLPNTILSLDRTIKLRIPFVQGKYNMGGTGALIFCGRHNLQLVLSKRNPALLGTQKSESSDNNWGFTIVRREDPGEGRRSSVFTYLAPISCDSNPQKGGVLHFSATSMPIFPERDRPYIRESEWGTLIKLYEYEIAGKTHILMRGGIMRRLDLLLPQVALPIRLHECRGFGGKRGSFDTNIAGISVRLEDDKKENLETGFPSSCPLNVAGEKMNATIYAFKRDKSETYKRSEGIVFAVNGQTHGDISNHFFRRKKVGLSYLADSILVILDCSELSNRAREDLIMNSRDRLSGGVFRRNIESELEKILKDHQGLRDLKSKRRQEEIESRIEDSKPLEDVLRPLLEQSPTLSTLFLLGKRLSTPFKTKMVKSEDKPYEGKKYPTYFKFKDKEYGVTLSRECHINMRARVTFETDANNDYFSRRIDPGVFTLVRMVDDKPRIDMNYSLNLYNGIATLNIQLPTDCRIGDRLMFVANVSDRTRAEPLTNVFQLIVRSQIEASRGGDKRRKKPGTGEGQDREAQTGIKLPEITRVYEESRNGHKRWDDMKPTPFDKYSALRVKHFGQEEDDGDSESTQKEVYDFFINMDNLYLRTEEKQSRIDAQLLEARFETGMVLIGLGLLHEYISSWKSSHDEKSNDDEEGELDIYDRIEEVTKAIAPVLLPMIEHLGALDLYGSAD